MPVKQHNVERRSPRASELCGACHNPVFLAERLMVNGRLHHRVCFRCARCNSQLSLANYYETETGQYCCETCPDEVKNSACQSVEPVESHKQKSSSDNCNANKCDVIEVQLEQPQESPQLTATSGVNSVQKKLFLESLVDGTSDTSSLAFIDEVSLDATPLETVEPTKEPDDADTTAPSQPCPGDGIERELPETQPIDRVTELSSDEKPHIESMEGHVIESSSDEKSQVESQIHPPESVVCDEAIPSVVIDGVSLLEISEVIPEEEEDEEEKDEGEEREEEKDEEEREEEKDEGEASQTIDEVQAETPNANEEILTEQAPVSPKLETPFDEEDEEIEPARTDEAPESTEKAPATDDADAQTLPADEHDYPDDLNPFDDDSEEESPKKGSAATNNEALDASGSQSPKKVIPAPKLSLNPFDSDDDDDEDEETIETHRSSTKIKPERPPPPALRPAVSTSTIKPSPSPRKRPAPAPPTSLSPGSISRSPSLSERMSYRRKKSAPPPPPPSDGPDPDNARNVSVQSPAFEKAQKDMSNLQMQATALNKDAHGQWKRKKGPAPPRPLPQKRHLRKLPVQSIQQELNDIEVKQLELERQGVSLEQNIRDITEADDCDTGNNGGPHVEEMILQLFDLVNEKNELLRRQSELMFIRRQQRLEEEHAELEFQIRCLMEKPAVEKSDEDLLKEEELIERYLTVLFKDCKCTNGLFYSLVQVVHRRAEIVDCLEFDRRRQAEEDESIQKHLDDFNTRHSKSPEVTGAESVEPERKSQAKLKSKTLKAIQAPIKLMSKDKSAKRKKEKSNARTEEDSENQNSKPSSSDQPSEHHAIKDKDKKKTKSWFTK